jgi:uroporphyrinogen decarboxylase
MTSRERIRRALRHEEPDRVPFDLGGSVVTGIAAAAYACLAPACGLPHRPVRIRSLYSQTAEIDPDVWAVLGADARPLDIHDPQSWLPAFHEKAGRRMYTDEWGIRLAMPLDGLSGYSAVEHPLAGASSVSDIERFPWPNGSDPSRFAGLAEQARALAEDHNVGVILETNIGGVFEWPQWLRGTAQFFTDLSASPAMAQALIEKILEFKLAFWESALAQAGPYVDLVRESDDLAGQAGLLISPQMYRAFLQPAHRQIVAAIKQRTGAAVCLHTCGAIGRLIPDLIEAGFDALNPVQVGAAGMEPEKLKRDYGRDLVLWGGSVDSQALARLAPAEVKQQARRNLEALAPGGGYICAPINMINADVPPENILALAQAVREYGSG